LFKYTTLYFDLFNTLLSVGNVPEHVGQFTADVLQIDHEQWNTACFSSAHEITQASEHEKIIRTLAHSIDRNIADELIINATAHRQRRFDYALMNVQQDILGVLADLKQRGVQLCLISNASTAEVSAWQHSPLAKIFDHAVFSCDCGFKKPDLDIYRYAMKCCASMPSNAAFIGDGGSDEFIGASQAGLTTVLTRQFSKIHRIDKVKQTQGNVISHEIKHLGEVQDVLKR